MDDVRDIKVNPLPGPVYSDKRWASNTFPASALPNYYLCNNSRGVGPQPRSNQGDYP